MLAAFPDKAEGVCTAKRMLLCCRGRLLHFKAEAAVVQRGCCCGRN